MVKTVLLNLYFWPVFVFFTILSLLVLPIILLVSCGLLFRSLASVIRRCILIYGWVLVKLVPFFCPVRVIGEVRSLPTPVIFVANHNSAIDPYVFGALFLENSFVTSWPFAIPIYNVLMRLAGYVDATQGWDEMKSQCFELLEDGSSVTIWPEGHRSRDGRLGRFRNGAFQLAVESDRPVVPVCILGSGKVMPPGSRILHPGKVHLMILEPILPEWKDDLNQSVLILKKRVRQHMEEALEECGHFHQASAI